MLWKELVEQKEEVITCDLHEFYGIQRDKNGYGYVNSPFPTLQDFFDRFIAEIDFEDVELDDEENVDYDGPEIKESQRSIEETYNLIKEERERFLEQIEQIEAKRRNK